MKSILQTQLQAESSPSPSPASALSTGSVELGVGVLVVGLVITILFAAFLGYAMKSFYDVFKAGLSAGQVIEAKPADPIVHVQLAGTQGTSGINIDGPPNVDIGTEATFRVSHADGSSPTQVEWSVEPKDAATITPGAATAKVKASKAGQFRIIAKVVEDQAGKKSTLIASTTVQAKVSEAAATRPSVLFFGQGYVTLLVLPLLLTVVALLGVAGVLTGEALAAVVSAIVGFLFGHAAASSGSGSEPKSKS